MNCKHNYVSLVRAEDDVWGPYAIWQCDDCGLLQPQRDVSFDVEVSTLPQVDEETMRYGYESILADIFDWYPYQPETRAAQLMALARQR